MVTDLAPARGLERESASLIGRTDVARDAGEGGVATVRKTVGAGRLRVSRPWWRGEVRRPDVPLSPSDLVDGFDVCGAAHPQHAVGIEWQWRQPPDSRGAPFPHAGMACHAIAGVHFRRVWSMAGEALLSHLTVRGAGMKWRLAPVRMTAGRGAGLGSGLRCFLGVGVVAGATDTVVRLQCFHVPGEHALHLVAAKALRASRSHGPAPFVRPSCRA
jgi:hypothetical protein